MVRTDGRPIVATALAAWLVAVLAACGDGQGTGKGQPPFLAFGCGEGQPFLACFAGQDTARLVAADGVRTLVRVPSGAGVRYAGGTDTLWTKGGEALLVRGDRAFRGCTPTGRQRVLAELWRDGAVFTAAGNEPFWTLTAWPDSLVLLLDLGATRLRHDLGADRPGPGEPGTWEEPAAGIAVTVEPGPCLDTMSGAPFPWRVTVRWQGRELSGCGLDLRGRI